MSRSCANTHEVIERTKLSQKVLYHFAILTIVNGLLLKIAEFAQPIAQCKRAASYLHEELFKDDIQS